MNTGELVSIQCWKMSSCKDKHTSPKLSWLKGKNYVPSCTKASDRPYEGSLPVPPSARFKCNLKDKEFFISDDNTEKSRNIECKELHTVCVSKLPSQLAMHFAQSDSATNVTCDDPEQVPIATFASQPHHGTESASPKTEARLGGDEKNTLACDLEQHKFQLEYHDTHEKHDVANITCYKKNACIDSTNSNVTWAVNGFELTPSCKDGEVVATTLPGQQPLVSTANGTFECLYASNNSFVSGGIEYAAVSCIKGESGEDKKTEEEGNEGANVGMFVGIVVGVLLLLTNE